MLPQFGFTELLLIAIIALVVVGPKDLPVMMRKLGQFLARGRAMANEFRAAFDDIAKQAELDELRQEIEALKRDNQIVSAVDDLKAVEKDINESVMRESPSAESPKPVSDKPSEPDAA
ncbi:MAG: Sec-independent protein translocase protein TatB [Henriciella sp.]|nr:Sec-independent protein translocase protein TatB [Henriciella sp.]